MNGLRQLSLGRCRERRPIHYWYPARSPLQCYWKSTAQPLPVDSVNRCDFETHPGWLARRSIALGAQHLSKLVGLRICDTAFWDKGLPVWNLSVKYFSWSESEFARIISPESVIWNLESLRRSFQPKVVRKIVFIWLAQQFRKSPLKWRFSPLFYRYVIEERSRVVRRRYLWPSRQTDLR